MVPRILVALAVALVVWCVALAIAVIVARARGRSVAGLGRILPDTLRLSRRLAADRSVPRGVRWRLGIAVIYNVQPINLIPDFIPVIGLLDNVVVIGWALRSAIRIAGPEAVTRHWPGSPEELAELYRITRLAIPSPTAQPGPRALVQH